MVNPQWSTEGQVVSDFGILPWQRNAALEFVDGFKWAYAAQSLRISGDYCKWLYTYPQGWQVSVLKGPRDAKCIIQSPDERPPYKQVQEVLWSLPWSMSSKPLLKRIQAEAEFNQKSAQAAPSRNKDNVG
jgi:hypothetical protein